MSQGATASATKGLVYKVNGRVVTRGEFLKDSRGIPEDGSIVGMQVAGMENKGPARRMYGSPHQGRTDWGLRVKTFGRADRNRKMQERGRQIGKKIECVG